jgi:hypothetical protein
MRAADLRPNWGKAEEGEGGSRLAAFLRFFISFSLSSFFFGFDFRGADERERVKKERGNVLFFHLARRRARFLCVFFSLYHLHVLKYFLFDNDMYI